jgi:uncharacterized protein (DUF736 family)
MVHLLYTGGRPSLFVPVGCSLWGLLVFAGILNIAHSRQKLIHHAVHMIVNAEFGEAWGRDEKRDSKLVFIGKNLDANELAARFNACLANPENLKKKEEALRFSVGDRVECRLCDHWHSGTVVALLYRDGNMPPGKVAPYQIQLDVRSLPATRTTGSRALARLE